MDCAGKLLPMGHSAGGAGFLSLVKDTCLDACDWSPDITELLPFREAVNTQPGMLMLEGFLLVIDCHPHSPVGIITP